MLHLLYNLQPEKKELENSGLNVSMKTNRTMCSGKSLQWWMASCLNATQVVNNFIWLELINKNTSWRFVFHKHKKKLKQMTIYCTFCTYESFLKKINKPVKQIYIYLSFKVLLAYIKGMHGLFGRFHAIKVILTHEVLTRLIVWSPETH